VLVGLLLWQLSGTRLKFLPRGVDNEYVRLAVAAAVAAVAFGIVNVGGNALRDAGSGTAFTPVNGLATAFPYNTSHNPMCAPLAAAACPAV
jgi:hypothetical protein